eukprot:scaffold301_cov243-Pinguiococcus_pyrenoidosus.AAC.20
MCVRSHARLAAAPGKHEADTSSAGGRGFAPLVVSAATHCSSKTSGRSEEGAGCVWRDLLRSELNAARISARSQASGSSKKRNHRTRVENFWHLPMVCDPQKIALLIQRSNCQRSTAEPIDSSSAPFVLCMGKITFGEYPTRICTRTLGPIVGPTVRPLESIYAAHKQILQAMRIPSITGSCCRAFAPRATPKASQDASSAVLARETARSRRSARACPAVQYVSARGMRPLRAPVAAAETSER